jgi:hypothetical protein
VRTALPPVERVFYDGQIFDASLKDLGKKLFAFSRVEMAADNTLRPSFRIQSAIAIHR